jgi:hypothetical protein
MTVEQLLARYNTSLKKNIPQEVLDIVVGDKLYDKKYIILRRWFISHA